MNIDKFIELLKENLEIEDQQLTPFSKLREIDGYDSMAVLAIIALADEHFGKMVTALDFKNFTTIQSLADFIGIENFQD